MEAKDLKAIIEQVLQEMNVSSDEKTTAAVAAATEAAAPKAVASEGISLKIQMCIRDRVQADISEAGLGGARCG